MILYTPLSNEEIFPADEKEWEQRKDIPIEFGMVTIRKESDKWTVCCLQSSNPQDYLSPKYQPGTEWVL
ncbi:YlzJ-like family protein [Alteribacillus iranensis]|uniref:YlzJ-like protein n=1 Tax=Alteribacillus iranensis TaxID=930128 RepID=A0A1I2A1R2_9BACI|nr:YlzJ-like family protein [Alteribacillus iranensis]SFE37912.1 YlzJ-like protein [Alteribacillus iranensis]